MSDRFDVVIVGGGIVGLATARAIVRARPRLARDPREGAAHRAAPDRSQLGRAALRHLLPARVAEGGEVRRGPARDGAVLRRARSPVRRLRQGDRRRRHARAAAARRSSRSAARRQRRARGAGRRRAPPRARAARGRYRRAARPETGIVDYSRWRDALAERIAVAGAELRLGTSAIGVEEARDGDHGAAPTAGDVARCVLVNCAGLQSDRVARADGVRPTCRSCRSAASTTSWCRRAPRSCRHLIYPVPDPELPFLGVHLSRGIDGGVQCGPNAVLALAARGTRGAQSRLGSCAGSPRSRILAHGPAATGRSAGRGVPVAQQARARARVARLVPGITETDLVPYPAGVRAQAVAATARCSTTSSPGDPRGARAERAVTRGDRITGHR